MSWNRTSSRVYFVGLALKSIHHTNSSNYLFLGRDFIYNHFLSRQKNSFQTRRIHSTRLPTCVLLRIVRKTEQILPSTRDFSQTVLNFRPNKRTRKPRKCYNRSKQFGLVAGYEQNFRLSSWTRGRNKFRELNGGPETEFGPDRVRSSTRNVASIDESSSDRFDGILTV